MMIAFDFVVVAFLCLAIATGLRTMHRHREFFGQFDYIDLCHGRLDAVFYTVNTLSTAMCLIDIAIRVNWALTEGWEGVSVHWAYISFLFHMSYAIGSAVLHVVTDRLLDRSDFCAICRRPWNRG